MSHMIFFTITSGIDIVNIRNYITASFEIDSAGITCYTDRNGKIDTIIAYKDVV